MERLLLLGGVAVGVMSAAAPLPAAAVPNNPLITWQGSVTLLTTSANCGAVPDFAPGILAYSIFRPRLDPAEPESALSIIFPRGTLIFTRATGENQMHGVGNYSGIWISDRVTANAAVSGTYRFTIVPAGAITSANNFVTMSGTITKWAAIAGCTVTFRGAYSRRPN